MHIAEQFELPLNAEMRPIPFEVEYPIAGFILATWYKKGNRPLKWHLTINENKVKCRHVSDRSNPNA